MIKKPVPAERSAYVPPTTEVVVSGYLRTSRRMDADVLVCKCVFVCVASNAYNTRVRCAFVACAQDVYETSDDNNHTDHERRGPLCQTHRARSRVIYIISAALSLQLVTCALNSFRRSDFFTVTLSDPPWGLLFPIQFRFRIFKIPPVTYITPPTDSTLADVVNGGGGLPFSTTYLFMVGILIVYMFLMLRKDNRRRHPYYISDDFSDDSES
ncbi:unnamed protein product [Macrosiphum euphorbiae]|uniref:Uncharacterized protein n=1 Tax=Macrosiphum euphorbiae TaxID=13131 RepID=A0AAV0WI05_9HEMI|nr:unnamed protein product [Macrosiphum euphorbiae]